MKRHLNHILALVDRYALEAAQTEAGLASEKARAARSTVVSHTKQLTREVVRLRAINRQLSKKGIR